MSKLVLVIGNKRYSSWSLRPWLALRQAGLPFEEVLIRLYRPGSKEEILRYSPSGKVPCLIDGDRVIWESLAICEYLAELAPAAGLWPADAAARAHARSVSAEMHAGFAAMRRVLSMDIEEYKPLAEVPDDAQADIRRVTAIWNDCRARFGAGGPFLFGAFTIADAMFAPVVTRFTTYGVPLDPVCAAYSEAVWALPAMQEWKAAAIGEGELGT